MEELFNKVELLTNNIDDLDLKAHLIQYKKCIKSVIDCFNNGNETLKNRIINDNIFTELVFDKIIFNIDNNSDKAKYLLVKEVQRMRIMLFFLEKGVYTHEVLTQDVALETLTEYQKQYLKKTGVKVDKKFNYKDLNLNNNDISRISCMVIHPSLIEDNFVYFK